MLEEVSYTRWIESGLVEGFVEATHDFNSLHRDNDRAVRLFRALEGDAGLNYNLEDGAKKYSYRIIPGALLIQDIGPLTHNLTRKINNPSLMRVKQTYKLKRTGLTSSVSRPVTTRVWMEYQARKQDNSVECCFKSRIEIGGNHSLPRELASGIAILATNPNTKKELNPLERYNPVLSRIGTINFGYHDLLNLEKHGVYLEYWPTEITAALWNIWETIPHDKNTEMLFTGQEITIDPLAHGNEFKLDFNIHEPEDRRIGVQRRVNTQGTLNNSIFLRAETAGLEKKVA